MGRRGKSYIRVHGSETAAMGGLATLGGDVLNLINS